MSDSESHTEEYTESESWDADDGIVCFDAPVSEAKNKERLSGSGKAKVLAVAAKEYDVPPPKAKEAKKAVATEEAKKEEVKEEKKEEPKAELKKD